MSNSRLPLSSLSANSVNRVGTKRGGVGTKRQRVAGGKNRHIPSLTDPKRDTPRQAYVPLGPRVEHIGQSLLPFDATDVTELKIFELFWDLEVVGVIVEGTNAYAEEKGAGKATPGGVGFRRPWKKVTTKEIRVFLALLIYMGARRGCGSNSFWGKEGEHREVFRAMSQKRFSQIKRYLHISDPALQLSRSEWFQKLEPLSSMLQSRSQRYYLPASNVTVDEMMIRFGGRSHHTYRMPSKPITEGYKVFALCDIGYTYSWIFASRSNSFTGLISHPDLTPTGATVFQLATSLPYSTSSGLHFNIYMDNYFPSQALLIKLRELGIGACGTARVNASAFPPELHDDRKNIPWNEVSGGPADVGGKVLAVQWQDNSAVHFLSTIHSLEDRIISDRKKPRISSSNGPAIRRVFGPQERINVPIPVITNDYNRYKVGVDVADQYRSYYFTQLKCLRNWPPIFYWLLDTTVINTYLLLRRITSDTPTSTPLPSDSCHYGPSSRTFRLALAKSLITAYAPKSSRRSGSSCTQNPYYTRKTTSPRYSLLQNNTSLPPPTGSMDQHDLVWMGGARVGCTACRFILRGMKRKGARAKSTRFGCMGPGCGFSLCPSCFSNRHKRLLS